MDKYKKNYTNCAKNNNLYISGNVVKKGMLQKTQKVNTTKKDKPFAKPKTKVCYKQRKKEQQGFSLLYTLFLFVMVVIIILSCITYLDTGAKINTTKQEIKSMQNQLDNLVTKNNSLDYDINGYIDVDYILDTATNKLGMIVGNSKQIHFYDRTIDEYMEQFIYE